MRRGKTGWYYAMVLILLPVALSYGQFRKFPLQTNDSIEQARWVQSKLSAMTTRDKIAQLFMVAAYPAQGEENEKYIAELIEKHHIGGLIMMQGTPYEQARLTNAYQALSKIPLLIGFDGEWGLSMRMDSVRKFPWNMTLGAVRNNLLLEELGRQIGLQCKRMGIHLNFAPVVDINTNPANPIIGNRSFGEDPYQVSEKSLAWLKGLQSAGIMGCAKHFPGHGDTSRDSHKELPVVNFDYNHLDSIEWLPYKILFRNGLSSVMSAHLQVPALDSTRVPASLSPDVVNGILRDSLHFNGLIITDALNMKGAGMYKPGELELHAFLAGNDILLFSQDIPKAIKKIEKAVKKGTVSMQRLDRSVSKILAAKYKAGLHAYKPVDLHNIAGELNPVSGEVLFRKLTASSITLVKRDKKIFPVRRLPRRIAYYRLGDDSGDAFLQTLRLYAPVTDLSKLTYRRLADTLPHFDLLIAGFHKSDAHPWKKYDFTGSEIRLLEQFNKKIPVILSVFTSPYCLRKISGDIPAQTLLVAYQNNKVAQSVTAQIIFGALPVNGKLPVSIGKYPAGYGLFSPDIKRLSYGIPEEVGMDSRALQRIDSIMEEVINGKMAPGGVVLAGRYGKVIYHKAFGYHTDEKKHRVQLSDLYDLASLTKILGSLPLIMKAWEEGRIDLDGRLDAWMPFVKGTNKDSLIVRKILSHYARLQAWIPFYKSTLDSITGKPLPAYYRSKPDKNYHIKITDQLYLRSDYRDTIYKKILDSPLLEHTQYKYSGLIFYLLKKYISQTYGRPMNELDAEWFYEPLGASSVGYLPLQKFNALQIVPTEKDTYFRHKLLRGTVHDMGAAMMGGVSGNAGLFGNANDVAKMMQMYLQKGYYGGRRYFYSSTIDTFNTAYYAKDSVRRGLVFDKPQINPEEEITCGCWSFKSFGHSGFTGTYAWVDPETGLLYVFLSNRVYPTMENTKLVDEDIRTKIQGFLKDAIIEGN